MASVSDSSITGNEASGWHICLRPESRAVCVELSLCSAVTLSVAWSSEQSLVPTKEGVVADLNEASLLHINSGSVRASLAHPENSFLFGSLFSPGSRKLGRAGSWSLHV